MSIAILVCPLSKVREVVESRRPARVISLLDPGFVFPDLGSIRDAAHLKLAFHDAHVASAGVVLPAAQHVDQLLAFLASWDRDGSPLVHCRAGIGRSTATAFIAACWYNSMVAELDIASILRRNAPLARPNETLASLADRAMDRAGRLSSAISSTGKDLPWIDVDEGLPFEIPLRY